MTRWLALAILAAVLGCRGGPRFLGDVGEAAGDILLAGDNPEEIPIDTEAILWDNTWYKGDFFRELATDFDAILDIDGLRASPEAEAGGR